MRSLVIAGLVAGAVVARAESRILIVETRGAPTLPALASQLALHANATLTVERDADADPLTYAERAAERVARGDARLVVWTAPVDGGYLVLVAGSTPARALTELVRIDPSIGVAEVERTIALKIAGLLETLTATPAVAVLEATIPTRAAAVPRQAASRVWHVEVTAHAAYERHERDADARVGLAVGRELRRGHLGVQAMLGMYWQPSGTIEHASGRVAITELGGVGAVEGRLVGDIEPFARLRFVAAGLAARAVSTDGRRGEAQLFAPYAGLEAGAFKRLATVRVGAVAGCDFALIRRELQIDGATIVDLGLLRLHVGLQLRVDL